MDRKITDLLPTDKIHSEIYDTNRKIIVPAREVQLQKFGVQISGAL